MADVTNLYEIGMREEYCMYIRRIVAIEDFEIDGLKSSWKIDLEEPYEGRSEKLPRGLSGGPISIGWYTLARTYDSLDDLPMHIQRILSKDSLALWLFEANLLKAKPAKPALESPGEDRGCELDDRSSGGTTGYTVEWSGFGPDFTTTNTILPDGTTTVYYSPGDSFTSSCTPESESYNPFYQRDVSLDTFHLPINQTGFQGCDNLTTGSYDTMKDDALSSEGGSTKHPWYEFLTVEALGRFESD